MQYWYLLYVILLHKLLYVGHIFQVWNLTNCRLKINHIGHTGYLNTVTVSPDGSLCASGGKVRVYFLIYCLLKYFSVRLLLRNHFHSEYIVKESLSF